MPAGLEVAANSRNGEEGDYFAGMQLRGYISIISRPYVYIIHVRG